MDIKTFISSYKNVVILGVVVIAIFVFFVPFMPEKTNLPNCPLKWYPLTISRQLGLVLVVGVPS